MNQFNSIIQDVEHRSTVFDTKLAYIENFVMAEIADQDDVLSDTDVNAAVDAIQIASKLFALAHNIALGLPANSPAAHQQVSEALAGLSVFADCVLATGDQDGKER
ncbi:MULTISPECIES: hypothetical protein [unclassified Mesorhizobium]|uniref:hypothetical protein n=1 Tax=unclassified Mesorhizobium TaxID=325217 RepID=UPI00333781D6